MAAAFKSVCFIYPDDGHGSKYDRMFPPLGLELVAGSVRDCVRDRCMIDLRFEVQWGKRVPANADLVALSLLWDAPLGHLFQMVRRIIEYTPRAAQMIVAAAEAPACSPALTIHRDFLFEVTT